jgi:hypothetical protein
MHDGNGHRFLQADRESYDGVKAYYYAVAAPKNRRRLLAVAIS